ncbi:GNAT family N-acetyltransferase [Schumannella soli]|uniref:GNAT family N-acetyltransferase n=2 Tax=Schumannella soli TaxID=2590779 RepID=A0A506XWP2_9MICO|nr:GNAT family N-acetyltransferase [Schumannella soli]
MAAMADIVEGRVRLEPATLDQLDAYFRDPDQLAEALRSPLPEGWPSDVNAFLWVANALQRAPEAAARWMYWAIEAETGRLIGDGGLRSEKPGVLDVSYELAEEFRGRGLGAPLVDALCRIGFEDPAITRIEAHTRVDDEASPSTLLRAGFERVGVIEPLDPEVGRPAVEWVRRRG